MRSHLTIALLFLATLAGCAITPNELRATAPVDTYQRRSAPPQMAECLEQKLRNTHGDLTAYREVLAGGRIDVTGRTEDRGAMFIFQISPATDGSSITLYIHPDIQQKRAAMGAELMSGC